MVTPYPRLRVGGFCVQGDAMTTYRCPYCPFQSDFASPVMFHIGYHHPGRAIPVVKDLQHSE